MAFQTKVYIVQKADRKGNLGEIVGVKTSFGPAQRLSKAFAPAKVTFAIADKTDEPNIPEQYPDRK